MTAIRGRPKTAMEMMMGPFIEHECVELVGGPLDGKRFREIEGSPRTSHNTAERYRFNGAVYRPDRMKGRVLFMVHVVEVPHGKSGVS